MGNLMGEWRWWRKQVESENPHAHVTRSELLEEHNSNRTTLLAVIVLVFGFGIASVLGLWAVVQRGDRERAENFTILCQTLQSQAHLSSLRADRLGARDAKVAEAVKESPIKAIRDLRDDYLDTAAFNRAFAEAQRRFSDQDCGDLPPPIDKRIDVETLLRRFGTDANGGASP